MCAKEAATALRLRKGNNRSAMPILFLYRHYLEIALKDALDRSKVFDLSQSEEKFGHNLAKLWGEAEGVLRQFVCADWLVPVESAVEAFNVIGGPTRFDTRQIPRATPKCQRAHM